MFCYWVSLASFSQEVHVFLRHILPCLWDNWSPKWFWPRKMPPLELSEWVTWARCTPSAWVKRVGGNHLLPLPNSLGLLKSSNFLLVSYKVFFLLPGSSMMTRVHLARVWSGWRLSHHSGVGKSSSGRHWCKLHATLPFILSEMFITFYTSLHYLVHEFQDLIAN